MGNTLGRGTRVTLHLKEDAHDYLSEDKLKESAKKYSQFIQFPIYVKVKKEVDAEAEEDDDDDDKDDEEEKDDVETKDDDEDKEEEEKKAPTKKGGVRMGTGEYAESNLASCKGGCHGG